MNPQPNPRAIPSFPAALRIARGALSRTDTHLILSLVILVLDLLTGRYIQFPILFVIPVALSAWYRGTRLAYTLAVTIPIGRFLIAVLVDIPSPLPYMVANSIIRILVLAFIAHVVARMARQTTELARSREQLKAMPRHLIEAQELERQYVARELHDGVGQTLTALKLMLESAESGSARDIATLVDANALVSDLISQVRDLSTELRPRILDDLGLVPALNWLLERHETTRKIHTHFRADGIRGRLPAEIENTAYRIVQEVLTNASRHAEAGEITVSIEQSGGRILLEIIDFGLGFDLGTVLDARRAEGLPGIQDRVALVGGRLTIATSSGSRTWISADLPLDVPAS